MANARIRTFARDNAILQWQIAEALGISEFTFSRKLRRELPLEEQDRIVNIIENLVAEREASA